MNESRDIDIETVRVEALRKLGRNIVNFSKIEGALKYLLSVSQFEGTKETISKQFHRNHDKYHKHTLGMLKQELHKIVLVDSRQVEAKKTSSNSNFSVSFNVTYDDPNFLESQKRALSDIVLERNKLIHQDLALLDTSCIEDYHNLIIMLDEQNPRLLAYLEDLRWIIEAISDMWKTEFIQYIKSNQIDA